MIREVPFASLPEHLQNIPGPPKQLFINTHQVETFDELMQRPRVAIVGSRSVSPYGQVVAAKLAGELAAQGIVIVSGLAFGVDAIAHRAALDAKGLTLAVLPTPADSTYPRSHTQLAHELLDAGGAIVSEYQSGSRIFKTNFVARNRIVTGLSSALLIIEAAEKSGSLHTADFAIDQGIDVLVVPGNITSPTSVGTNNLIKTGALVVTSADDVLLALGLQAKTKANHYPTRIEGSNAEEQRIIDLLEQGVNEGNELLHASKLSVEQFNHHLTMLEITTKIRPLGANRWALR